MKGSRRPAGWGHYENTPDRWGATGEEFHIGKRSAFLQITGFGNDDCACAGLAVGRTDGYSGRDAIPVEPNTSYHFAFYIAGYGKPKAGTVRIWDANKKYTMKHYDMRAWRNRDAWSQVPHGPTSYRFRGDPVLEGKNFWVSLHSSRHDAVFLYAKTDSEATPGRHNEMYRVFDTPNGLRNYGGGSQACRILKNSPEEILVESEAITYERGGFETTVTTRYRLVGGKPWVEIQPVSQTDEQGMHGESRFVLAPEAAENGGDFVDDSLKRPGKWRLVLAIDGAYHTMPITIATADTASPSLTFASPATGTLEYVLFYLYDRTDGTPKHIWTPMDICRDTTAVRPEPGEEKH